ncbi:MAG: hypothetical protein HC875_23115 [Anaerolineales bacterium]|nr:hypothetical protein [Anaerolineales bacterium]
MASHSTQRGGPARLTSPPRRCFVLHLLLAERCPLTVDLTCFAHLLDQNGQVVAQLDWTPQDGLGYLPTTAWQPGRPVVDRQSLSLPAGIAPGEYRLMVGWYYPVTGDRLPVTAGGGGDTVEVGVIRVGQ